jgi:hypothetical protein
LQEAIANLSSQCEKLKRGIRGGDWRILVPIIEGKESPHHQDAWEICLLGVADLPVQIPLWMQVCRSVDPNLVEGGSNNAGWIALLEGGEWPKITTEGHTVGLYKAQLSRKGSFGNRNVPQTGTNKMNKPGTGKQSGSN